MSLPEQLLLSDLLRRRVRCDRGLERGAGLRVWMHPPVHRVLGWVTRPSAFGNRRLVWRLDQLRALLELEALVKGDPAETDQDTIERLPTLIEASLLDARREPIGTLADAAIELRTGRIRHYLVSRSDPRLPGSSRWRLSPERIVDQQPGLVFTALQGLDDLPLARASVRQEFLRRSRRWRDQVQEETSRLRDQFQEAGDRLEGRVEGWLEEPPWEAAAEPRRDWGPPQDPPPDDGEDPEPWDDHWGVEPSEQESPPSWMAQPRARRRRHQPDPDGDPWI
ncbi:MULTISPECIES: hypothetical protein [Aphanothece]|uniref:hypothetical protein n=1 Tax=Aphanothece TaxID=1121 RepID=UPI003984F2DA